MKSMKAATLLLLVLFVFIPTARAATIHNDDSCDIGTLPAATLLLPYFEVDLDDVNGETTLFTVVNVTNVDRIARVTLWTDRGFAVIAFNIYLTGYDVQAINLRDVIVRGLIAPPSGTGTEVTKHGTFSDPNLDIDLTGCARLAGALDAATLLRMRAAFTGGAVRVGNDPQCTGVSDSHANAVGYATIDVVRTCSTHLPTDRLYWVEDIAFDNVLTGDYQQVDSANEFAQSSSMVHIRAVPEGGSPAQRRARPQDFDAGFRRTFYSRYQAAGEPRFDGRQPLPSTFSARWIQGGTGAFRTSFKIWREGHNSGASCADFRPEALPEFAEFVRFDEAENAVAKRPRPFPSPPVVMPLTSLTSVADPELYPIFPNNAGIAGWFYLNLDNCGRTAGCSDSVASQNWVVVSMRAEGRYSADMEATALGNGCSPPLPRSEVTNAGGPIIGPAGNSQ